jgi:Flp pilus assembly pilin Flp
MQALLHPKHHHHQGGHMNTIEKVSTTRAERKAGRRKNIAQPLTRAWVACGQGLVEYALILALIAIVTIGVLTQLGGKTSQIFSSVNCTLAGGAQANTTTTGPGNAPVGVPPTVSTTTGSC